MIEVKTLTLGIMDTNVYLINLKDGVIVIDPAFYADKILLAARQFDKPIEYALLTHGHFDHCNAANELQRSGVKVLISDEDYKMIKSGLDLAKFCDVEFQSFEPDEIIGEGEIELCGEKIKVLATPGHTKGGLTYIIGDKIFCGDTLFRLSVGRSDLPTGDKKQLTASIKSLYALGGDYTVYPGHGAPTSLDFERKNNPYVKAI